MANSFYFDASALAKRYVPESGSAQVNAVFDTEEAKSTGVMNRLLAEKNNPQADVYWANEPVRADVLRQQGISTPYKPEAAAGIPEQFLDPQGYWTGFSARARVLVVNKSASFRPAARRNRARRGRDPAAPARAHPPDNESAAARSRRAWRVARNRSRRGAAGWDGREASK